MQSMKNSKTIDTLNIIIGAGGFIGAALTSALSKANAHVLAITGSNTVLESTGKILAINKRVSSFGFLDHHIRSAERCIVYYLINTTSPAKSHQAPHQDIENNLTLFISFLEWVSQKDNISKVVYTSSGGTVYGNNVEIPTLETSSTDPISFYGMSKLTAENYLKLFGKIHNINYTIARISNPYGTSQKLQRGQGLIAMLTEKISHQEPIHIIGKGTMVRDYIYIDDVITALLLCGENDALNKQIVNIASGRGYSIIEIVKIFEEILDIQIEKNYLPERKSDVETSILDITKMKSLTGWSPKTSIRTGISNILNSFQ